MLFKRLQSWVCVYKLAIINNLSNTYYAGGNTYDTRLYKL